MIIYILTKSSSKEIGDLIVVFIPLQFTLGRVVECSRDHVRLLNDLPNSMTLAQKIVASLVLLITKIITIENNKLDNTFLHITFGSQSLLKPISDQTDSDTN
jgi:hypothetical protein